MDVKTLNAMPHRTPQDLEAIPHITLEVRSDAASLPPFLRGTKTVAYYAEKTDRGWIGFRRLPRTGDFAGPVEFAAENYEICHG
jgi:hypothetical protein